jgi:hypothetical protein
MSPHQASAAASGYCLRKAVEYASAESARQSRHRETGAEESPGSTGQSAR